MDLSAISGGSVAHFQDAKGQIWWRRVCSDVQLRKVPYYLLLLWLITGALVSLTLTVYNLNVLFLIEVQL